MNDSSPQETPRRTLLIVDDQHGVLVSLRFLLEGFNYRIIVADSCAAALGAAEKEPIDGVLLDVHMPGTNGFETCLQLQAQGGALGRTLRVWFMTGAPTRLIENRAVELGSFGVFSKPFDHPEFLEQLERDFASPLPEPLPPRDPSASDLRDAAQPSAMSWNRTEMNG